MSQYREWFPPYDPSHLHAHEMYYREVCGWWSTDLRELPVEEPDEAFGFHVAVLRRKLQVIWLLASSGAEQEVLNRIDQLNTAYYRRYRLALDVLNDEWRRRLLGACGWLRWRFQGLKVCENPTCEQLTTYFFRRWNNHKYCSERCSLDADRLRRMERLKSMPFKRFKRSEEARLRMSESARRRWAKQSRRRESDQ